MYIIFINNSFMHTDNSLQHELPILTNTSNGKCQVQTKITSVDNQAKELTGQFKQSMCSKCLPLTFTCRN